MKKLNAFCLKILQFFESRSILFYIFWLSFFIGELFYQMLIKFKGCTPWLNENKLIGYSLNQYQNVEELYLVCGDLNQMVDTWSS